MRSNLTEAGMNENKVFGIGFMKSGTTSLDQLLGKLGYDVCHENMGDYDPDVANHLTQRMDDAVQRYDAFQDSPWCGFYERYAEMFPTSKFILTLRPLDKWLNSMSNYGDKVVPIWKPVYGADRFEGNETFFRDLYRAHTVKALDYFRTRPGRLLVIDIEADPDTLARSVEAFLGLHYTGASFPRSNVSRRSRVMWHLKGAKWRALARQAPKIPAAAGARA